MVNVVVRAAQIPFNWIGVEDKDASSQPTPAVLNLRPVKENLQEVMYYGGIAVDDVIDEMIQIFQPSQFGVDKIGGHEILFRVPRPFIGSTIGFFYMGLFEMLENANALIRFILDPETVITLHDVLDLRKPMDLLHQSVYGLALSSEFAYNIVTGRKVETSGINTLNCPTYELRMPDRTVHPSIRDKNLHPEAVKDTGVVCRAPCTALEPRFLDFTTCQSVLFRI